MSIVPCTSALGLLFVLLWRLREGRRPVTLKTVLIPPFGMATGFSMFLVPAFRIALTWATAAFLTGSLLLAYPLIRTSRLMLEDGVVSVHRSKAFLLVIVGVALGRFMARDYVGRFITLEQTAGLSFVLAFGMVLTWRTSMYLEYRRLVRTTVGPPRAVES
jgi:membrane protein CcdC involved in cytochrome C biogenesis